MKAHGRASVVVGLLFVLLPVGVIILLALFDTPRGDSTQETSPIWPKPIELIAGETPTDDDPSMRLSMICDDNSVVPFILWYKGNPDQSVTVFRKVGSGEISTQIIGKNGGDVGVPDGCGYGLDVILVTIKIIDGKMVLDKLPGT
jgi:hypothetical protein